MEEAKQIQYRVGIYGDLHLYSENYGSHRDYASESIDLMQNITKLVQDNGVTHLIGLGDFSFGNFKRLRYRKAIEEELIKQHELTNGNRWEMMGNHDKLAKDLSERDYYIEKGLLRPSENITLGKWHITMVDYDKASEVDVNFSDNEEDINVILAHDYYKFVGTALPNYGEAHELDYMDKWFGADFLICGHIHKCMKFTGSIMNGEFSKKCCVHYPGCAMRPAYTKDHMDDKVDFVLLTQYTDGTTEYNFIEIKLPPIEESFNLEKIARKEQKQAEKPESIDITQMVYSLDKHERVVGSPEEIIKAMEGVPEAYKNMALKLLKEAQ